MMSLTLLQYVATFSKHVWKAIVETQDFAIFFLNMYEFI